MYQAIKMETIHSSACRIFDGFESKAECFFLSLSSFSSKILWSTKTRNEPLSEHWASFLTVLPLCGNVAMWQCSMFNRQNTYSLFRSNASFSFAGENAMDLNAHLTFPSQNTRQDEMWLFAHKWFSQFNRFSFFRSFYNINAIITVSCQRSQIQTYKW